MPMRRVAFILLVCAVSLGATRAVRRAGAADPDGLRMTVARLQYDGGGDWYANPSSLPNLLDAIATRTSLKVERTEARITLMDDRLWDYPFIHVTGHGNIHFSDAEVAR
ncbi:MAG TPA: DUF4159 domain-containing protein, partial [Gemmatimonadaceae bacterium]|nr:DUF4159 domain-containing protein [Gemmatimonadaceae bacterium]